MRRTLASVAGGALLLVGCSGGGGGDVEGDPAGALQGAVEALGDYEGVAMELAFDGDPDALVEQGDLAGEDVELLLDSRIALTAIGGAEEGTGQFEMRVDLAGADVLEVRVLPDPRVFLRVDPEAFAQAVDDPEVTAGLDELIAGAEQFGLGDLVGTVLSGEWVELTGVDELMDMAEQFGAPAAPEEEPSEEEAEELQQRVSEALETFLDEDVEVAYVGAEDAGEHVTATTDGASLQALFEELTAIAGDVGGVDPALLGEVPEEEFATDETVELDVWLRDGRVSQVGVDLSQFDTEVPAGSSLLVGIEEATGSVEAPADAEPVDLIGQVTGALFGGMGAGMGDLGELEDAPAAPDADGGEAGDAEGMPTDMPCVTEEELEAAPELEALVDDGLLEAC